MRRQLQALSNFMGKLALADLTPDQHTVKHAAGAYARVLSSPGREYAMYFDGNGPVDVVLELPTGEYSGEWINTTTGETEGLERFRHRVGVKTLRSPAFQNGIALRREKWLPKAPGSEH